MGHHTIAAVYRMEEDLQAHPDHLRNDMVEFELEGRNRMMHLVVLVPIADIVHSIGQVDDRVDVIPTLDLEAVGVEVPPKSRLLVVAVLQCPIAQEVDIHPSFAGGTQDWDHNYLPWERDSRWHLHQTQNQNVDDEWVAEKDPEVQEDD